MYTLRNSHKMIWITGGFETHQNEILHVVKCAATWEVISKSDVVSCQNLSHQMGVFQNITTSNQQHVQYL